MWDNVIRCSKLARPMVCAGSLFFENIPEQEAGEAAREGTACGELLERLLTNQPIGTHAKNGVMFDEDMRFYMNHLRNEIVANAAGPITCEQRIDWQTRSGIWIKGSYDASYIGKDGALYVDDLKYGWGIVEVKENWQLLAYAIGEVNRRVKNGEVVERIVLRIHQPRPHHEHGTTRRWDITLHDLFDYKERIEARCAAIAAGDKTLQPSANCKYCPAAMFCPAFSKSVYRGVEYAHEFVQDDVTDAEISNQLDLVNRVAELIKIKQDSLKSLAIDRIRNGKIIPGYVTEANSGDRAWKQGVTADALFALTGVDAREVKMLSPAKAEKAGIPKSLVNAMVTRPFIGQKLVKKDTKELGNQIFGASAPTKEG